MRGRRRRGRQSGSGQEGWGWATGPERRPENAGPAQGVNRDACWRGAHSCSSCPRLGVQRTCPPGVGVAGRACTLGKALEAEAETDTTGRLGLVLGPVAGVAEGESRRPDGRRSSGRGGVCSVGRGAPRRPSRSPPVGGLPLSRSPSLSLSGGRGLPSCITVNRRCPAAVQTLPEMMGLQGGCRHSQGTNEAAAAPGGRRPRRRPTHRRARRSWPGGYCGRSFEGPPRGATAPVAREGRGEAPWLPAHGVHCPGISGGRPPGPRPAAPPPVAVAPPPGTATPPPSAAPPQLAAE